MNLQENISRIKEIMGINESKVLYNLNMIESDDQYDDDETLYDDDDYVKPEKTDNFEDSVVKDVVWRAGMIKSNPMGGGIWFGDSKKGVEDFAMSVRREKREGKPYRINLQNPFHYEKFWRGYVRDVDFPNGRQNIMHDLIAQGHDGIIIGDDMWNDTPEAPVYGKQYIVFDEKDVRPA